MNLVVEIAQLSLNSFYWRIWASSLPPNYIIIIFFFPGVGVWWRGSNLETLCTQFQQTSFVVTDFTLVQRFVVCLLSSVFTRFLQIPSVLLLHRRIQERCTRQPLPLRKLIYNVKMKLSFNTIALGLFKWSSRLQKATPSHLVTSLHSFHELLFPD